MASRLLIFVGIVAAAAIISSATWVLTSSNGSNGASPSAATIVKVDEGDFYIKLDRDSVPSGSVSFVLTNSGTMAHEFVILKTDLPADKLPQANDQAIEDSAQVTHIDEQQDFPAGESRTLTTNLESGKYVLLCNIAGHYKLGMYTAFTVNP
jgi:uncharacterized cupredoxin-like copper-binding protein